MGYCMKTYFKARESRGWLYIDLFSGVPHAVCLQTYIQQRLTAFSFFAWGMQVLSQYWSY